MDVHCSDGNALLLEYCSSYATKTRDHEVTCNRSSNLTGFGIDTKYINVMNVTEPKMAQQTSGMKLAHYKCIAKKYRVPHSKVSAEIA